MFYESKLLPTKLRTHSKKIIEVVSSDSSQVILVLLVCESVTIHPDISMSLSYKSTVSPLSRFEVFLVTSVHRPLECLVAVSGASVDRGPSLITLHLLLPYCLPENLPSVWKGFSHFFFVVGWSPQSVPADEPTDQSVRGHPTVTNESTSMPSIRKPNPDCNPFESEEVR